MISAADSSFRSPNLFAAPLEGIRRGVEQAGEAAGKIASGDVSPENIVSEIQATIVVKANSVAMRTADEILGTILDAKA